MKHSHGGDKLVAAVAAAFGQGYERPAARREWPSEAPREPFNLAADAALLDPDRDARPCAANRGS
jgi:hypothetical protein